MPSDDRELPPWFRAFAKKLVLRSGRNDWPDPTSEAGRVFWADFYGAIRRTGATPEEADEAASVACDTPDLWPNQFRPAIVEALKAQFARNQAQDRGQAAGSREEAEAASVGCPDCDGRTGLATRFVHASHAGRFASGRGESFPVGARVALACSCPLGRWLRKMNLDAPRDRRVAIPALEQFPEFALGPVDWSAAPDSPYRVHPDDWDGYSGRPIAPVAPSPREMVAGVVRPARAALAGTPGRFSEAS